MKRRFILLLALAALLMLAVAVPAGAKPAACTTIQDGVLADRYGNLLELGFDQFGYNYQAHLFVGTYDGLDRLLDGKYFGQTGDYVDDAVNMKWSEDWMSNRDCDGDGKLDRGAPGSAGWPFTSQGWETNHIVGDYDSDGDGIEDAHYTIFWKIAWVLPPGSLWGSYEIIQEVYNDPVGGLHGLQYKIPAPGFGLNDHWTSG